MAETHTSASGVYENISATWPGPTCGASTPTFFHLGTWGPVITMTGVVSILSGTAPPGVVPFVCTYSGGTYLYMVGTPTVPGVYTFTVRAALSDASNFDVDCVQTVSGTFAGYTTLPSGPYAIGPVMLLLYGSSAAAGGNRGQRKVSGAWAAIPTSSGMTTATALAMGT